MPHDYRIVDARNRFRLREVANLWAGHDPRVCDALPISAVDEPDHTASAVTRFVGIRERPRGAYQFFQFLKEAIEAGDLSAPVGETITDMTFMTRDAMENFTRKMNEDYFWSLPEFLFPEERKEDSPQARGGKASKRSGPLQDFVDALHTEIGDALTPQIIKAWIEERATPSEPYDPMDDFDHVDKIEGVYLETGRLHWTEHSGKTSHEKSITLRSIERYVARAKMNH